MKAPRKKARRIDPHVHCRDEGWSNKSTIAETLKIAEGQGICAIFDMPNNNPLTLNADDVRRRLALVPKDSPVEYYTYVGLTSDVDQITCAVNCWSIFKQVIGLKMFAGKSVGSMTVAGETDQGLVYQALAAMNYRGVLAVHCEKESLLRTKLWNPKVPVSHSWARPKIAEIESIEDQIEFAKIAGFKGTLHICHASCPESVELVMQARKAGKIRITCGITPHHALLSMVSQEAMRSLGNFYKVNPPLRTEEDMMTLRQYLIEGHIDWVETDQAKHTLAEKLGPLEYMSGIPSLYLYNDLIEAIRPDVSPAQLKKLTFSNIVKAFSPKLDHLLK